MQNVALRYVHEDDLPRLYSKLLAVGLAKSGALTMTAPIGCSGTTSCNLALTNSHRLAKEIQRKFLELKLDEDVQTLVDNMELQQLGSLAVVHVLEKTCMQITRCY
ncbi:sulfite reductase protein [Marine Group I thaumarchaeote SCGC AAA799-N04]|uniref:Sulfite reductase protein n=1 Tax=Marine Group I thaumarchaeote SCGC AAA799-N04 TaxID=1502293 RepID=A0A081RKS6_9ARCH|nr:sulfite reductase protein [Marine Group I thaumarchaeote SCGC AAA799-N04]